MKAKNNGANLDKLDDEAKIGLQQFNNVGNLDVLIEELTSTAQLTNI